MESWRDGSKTIKTINKRLKNYILHTYTKKVVSLSHKADSGKLQVIKKCDQDERSIYPPRKAG